MSTRILSDQDFSGARIQNLSTPIEGTEPARLTDLLGHVGAFVGEIRLFGGAVAPTNWASCNGQVLNVATYPALFAVLGNIYGGDGTTTFALPDLRGRVPIHIGQSTGTSNYNRGDSGGVENVALSAGQLPAHTHPFSATVPIAIPVKQTAGSTNIPDTAKILVASLDSRGGVVNIYGAGPATTTLLPFDATASGTTNSTGSGTNVPVLQPYAVINYIIALLGVAPS